MRLFLLAITAVWASKEILFEPPTVVSYAASAAIDKACNGDMFVISESSCDTEAFTLKLNNMVDKDGLKCYDSLLPNDKQLFHSQNVADDAECDQQGKAVHLGTGVITVEYATTCLIQTAKENGKTIYTTGLCKFKSSCHTLTDTILQIMKIRRANNAISRSAVNLLMLLKRLMILPMLMKSTM